MLCKILRAILPAVSDNTWYQYVMRSCTWYLVTRVTTRMFLPHRKRERETKWIRARKSKLFKDDPERFVQVLYVKSHHILGMEPFNYLENDERRHTLLVAGDKERPFPVERLSSKAVSTT